MKQFACTAFLNNDRGFTLISSLFMLSIIMLTIPFLTNILLFSKPTMYVDDFSVHEFFRFMRDELIESKQLQVNDNVLILKKGDDTVIIEQQDNLVRRQVNNGYEVYLRDVENMQIEETRYGIQMTITSMKGQTYEKALVFYNK